MLEKQNIQLLIKRYDDGAFTSDFLSGNFIGNVSISKTKGDGMGLNLKAPGLIVVIAGGTGIYPFIDLIDVLFKSVLIKQNPSIKQKVLQLTPAADDPHLNSFKFLFLLGFESFFDMHPITKYQCYKL